MRKFLIIGLLFSVTLAVADDSKISPDLRKYPGPQATVVVQYRNPPSLLDLRLITTLTGNILSQLPLVNGIVASLPLSKILVLSNQDNVKYITLDRALRPSLSNAAPAVNAFSAWQSGYTGQGISHRARDPDILPAPHAFVNCSPSYTIRACTSARCR